MVFWWSYISIKFWVFSSVISPLLHWSRWKSYFKVHEILKRRKKIFNIDQPHYYSLHFLCSFVLFVFYFFGVESWIAHFTKSILGEGEEGGEGEEEQGKNLTSNFWSITTDLPSSCEHFTIIFFQLLFVFNCFRVFPAQ